MGREIRRVPPNWEHPKEERLDYHRRKVETAYVPMHDTPYVDAITEWVDGWHAWERGERPPYCTPESAELPYWEYHDGPPDPKHYRKPWNAEPTWWQVYETVSEGTPVTPPFATTDELIDYLVANGDFWDQKRRSEGCSSMPCSPWTRDQAESFVKAGSAFSFAVDNGKLMSGVEFLAEHKNHAN